MLIGIKDNGNVWLAFSTLDSACMVSVKEMANKENVGLWRVKNNPHTIMGCAVSSAEADAFCYEEDLFSGKISYDKLITNIIPDMEKFAEDKEYIGDDKGVFEPFLIAQKDKLFAITPEHLVMEIESFFVFCDFGEDLVQSALYATKDEPVLERIRKAFEFVAREKQCNYYPISIMDTQTGLLETLPANDGVCKKTMQSMQVQ